MKIADQHLDDSSSLLFVFRKGDWVVNRQNERGMKDKRHFYPGELPTHTFDPKAKKVYEVKFPGEVLKTLDEKRDRENFRVKQFDRGSFWSVVSPRSPRFN